MFYNVLNFLLFIELFQTFENFYPLSYSLDCFDIIHDVGDLSECHFSRWIDPFVSISGIMSKLACRLGFITVCILHDLMIVSS